MRVHQKEPGSKLACMTGSFLMYAYGEKPYISKGSCEAAERRDERRLCACMALKVYIIDK